MSKNYTTGLIVLSILTLAFAFYWFEYRPSTIRKECGQEMIDSWTDKDRTKKYLPGESYSLGYKLCIQSKGIVE